jgi:hypothetical protein
MMIKPALALASVLCLCTACGGEAPQPAADARAEAPSPAKTPPGSPAIAPAIVQPEEFGDPAQPPSYEVAIASSAAEHNKAKERCTAQPESVRAQCEQEANAAFSDAREDLDRLRGNQP